MSPWRGPTHPQGSVPLETLFHVRLRLPESTSWLHLVKDGWNTTLKVRASQPTGAPPTHLLAWLEVTFAPMARDEILAFLRSRPSSDLVRVAQLADNRLMLYLSSPLPGICASILRAGGLCEFSPFLLNGPSDAPDDWGFIVPGTDSIMSLLDKAKLSTRAFKAEVMQIGPILPTPGISSRQEFAINLAFKLGYFENPRRASLSDVSAAMAVSPHAAMELLRRGVRELVTQHELT
jgi:hypothetical protein